MITRKAVVYAVDGSQKYVNMAIRSAYTLRKYNKEIEILLLITGDIIPKIAVNLSPFRVVKVNSPFNKFPSDMCCIGQLTDYSDILYFDSDSFVFGDVAKLFLNPNFDFYARLSTRFQKKESWIKEFDSVWRKTLIKAGANYGPVFNAGMTLFRNYSHCKIYNQWVDYIDKFYNAFFSEIYGGEYLFPQMALSIAVHKYELKYETLDKNSHSFAWLDESVDNSILFHTNSQLYPNYLSKIQAYYNDSIFNSI